MRRQSKKTAAIYRKWTPIRRAFIEEMGYICAGCSRGCPFDWSVHEMVRGKNRMRAFVSRASWLCLCGDCNCNKFTDNKLWPVERQLAVKYMVDREHFSISEINRLFASEGHPNPPNRVSIPAVCRWLDGITYGR